MHIEIINTGSELLLGSTLNTHGAWLGNELSMLGLRVERQTTVPDGDAIKEALAEAMERSNAVIVTGGLGPTSDDISRQAAAEALGVELITDEAALRSIEAYFKKIGRVMAEDNKRQALNPVGGDVLPNPNGTAPGIYTPPRMSGDRLCALFLLPGPPHELQAMFLDEVRPRICALAGVDPKSKAQQVKVLKFTGVGESDFHQALDARFLEIPHLEVGYCARPSEVDLRLIGEVSSIQQAMNLANETFPNKCFSEDGESLEKVVVDLLQAKDKKLSTAESCTGGLISSRITDVSGASQAFTAGYITYANEAKSKDLGVAPELIEAEGAVSEKVALAMAEGALRKSQADIAVAVTGIAGPTGGSDDKPVGTVWIAIATKKGSYAERHLYAFKRAIFKKSVSQRALDMVRRELDSAAAL